MTLQSTSSTTSTIAASPSTAVAGRLTPVENAGASFLAASYEVGARTVKKFARSPQLIIAGTAQGALFLLIFRYVFGGVGALATGSLSYVDFLVPGFVVTSVLFSGMGAATGIAEDLEGGLFDRLRSLPIRLLSIISGRIGADTALLTWGLAFTTLFGVLVGFRVQNGAGAAAMAFGLCVLYGFAFCWLFIGLGLVAGSPQAAQGISFLVFPLSFVSSAYVPIATMPGWMQGFASHQPLTYMCNTVRLLTGGHAAEQLLGHPIGSYLVPSLLWSAGLIAVFVPLTVWRLRRA
jgi:ABC-2 type transport system permease protein